MTFNVTFTEDNAAFNAALATTDESFGTELGEDGADFTAGFGVTTVIEHGGTNDYEALINKPQIEGVTLSGNKTFPELTLDEEDNETINETFKKVFG